MSARSEKRRELIADAGIRIVARDGVRALTHRAVDHEAHLPQGSTSYHAATRPALIELIVNTLASRTQSETDQLSVTVDEQIRQRRRLTVDDLAGLIAGMVDTLATRREEMRVRYALLLEVGDVPHLRDQLTTASDVHASTREIVASLLTAADIPNAVDIDEELIALTDSLVFHRTVIGSSHQAAQSILTAYLRGIALANTPGRNSESN